MPFADGQCLQGAPRAVASLSQGNAGTRRGGRGGRAHLRDDAGGLGARVLEEVDLRLADQMAIPAQQARPLSLRTSSGRWSQQRAAGSRGACLIEWPKFLFLAVSKLAAAPLAARARKPAARRPITEPQSSLCVSTVTHACQCLLRVPSHRIARRSASRHPPTAEGGRRARIHGVTRRHHRGHGGSHLPQNRGGEGLHPAVRAAGRRSGSAEEQRRSVRIAPPPHPCRPSCLPACPWPGRQTDLPLRGIRQVGSLVSG